MTAEARPASETRPKKQGFHWPSVLWIGGLHVGALVLAPFTFTWSGLVVCGVLYALTALGITLGYHRLLTHRGFQTPRVVEYLLTFLGVLANQGGPVKWVSAHRKHHAFSDEEGDPHSPQKGFWWAHVLWWMHYDPVLDDPIHGRDNVKDLVRDPYHRFLERWQILPPLALGGLLFGLGTLWQGAWLGLSWVVWGLFVRTVLVYHATWLVNSAAHIWGYRNFQTHDRSTNLWWVALLSLGEGWHNNHHAFQRSARHGLLWWEVDATYLVLRLLSLLGLARNIHVAPKPPTFAERAVGRERVIFPGRKVPQAREMTGSASSGEPQ
jgi:fatty-acid desaturase